MSALAICRNDGNEASAAMASSPHFSNQDVHRGLTEAMTRSPARRPEVRAAIAEKLGKTFDWLDISVERTLQELARLAYGDAVDLVEQ